MASFSGDTPREIFSAIRDGELPSSPGGKFARCGNKICMKVYHEASHLPTHSMLAAYLRVEPDRSDDLGNFNLEWYPPILTLRVFGFSADHREVGTSASRKESGELIAEEFRNHLHELMEIAGVQTIDFRTSCRFSR